MIRKTSEVYSVLNEQSKSIHNWDLYLDLIVGKTDLRKGVNKIKIKPY
jgi:hypothetical protein